MLVTDLDGTLIPYNQNNREATAFNHELVKQWQARGITAIAIATNQGGMNFADGLNRYPTTAVVAKRIRYAIDELAKYGITVKSVIASVYHLNADFKLTSNTMVRFIKNCEHLDIPISAKGTEQYRKPNPQMLFDLRATEYWGDSPEDEGAAKTARVKFYHVERF